MTAPGFLDQWWDYFVDWLLANDDQRPLRIGILAAAGILVWRAMWLASQSWPTPSPRITPATSETPSATAPTLRRWFPSRQDRLQQAVEQVRTETDLLLSKTAETKASAGLAKARAELAALMRELEPQPTSHAPELTAQTSLTLPEIEALLHLFDLDDQQRTPFLELVAAAIAEKRS